MICPKCEYEYVEGINLCPDCNSKLIPVEKFKGNLVHPSDWIIVYTCDEPYEAEMLKSNLEGAKIESLIISQKDRSFVVFGNLSLVKLLVKKTDQNEALAIINDINKKNLDESGE